MIMELIRNFKIKCDISLIEKINHGEKNILFFKNWKHIEIKNRKWTKKYLYFNI